MELLTTKQKFIVGLVVLMAVLSALVDAATMFMSVMIDGVFSGIQVFLILVLIGVVKIGKKK